MSYIPDYRKETDKLNEKDQAYIQGYRNAVEDVLRFLDDAEEIDADGETVEAVRDQVEINMELEEIEVVCSLFDHADYLPEDIELVDANQPAFVNTKGARVNGK